MGRLVKMEFPYYTLINDQLYLYAESLIQIEMYNDSVAIPFLKKIKKYTFFCPSIPQKYSIHFFKRV
jgi:hypothetical protein